MAAYVIADGLQVRDATAFREYQPQAAATVQQYGGKFLVLGGPAQTLEGDWQPSLVIIEFESAAQARAWYDSPEYRPLRDLRQRAVDMQVVLVEGV